MKLWRERGNGALPSRPALSREAYVIEALNRDSKLERLFFDVQSGYLLRRIVLTETPPSPASSRVPSVSSGGTPTDQIVG